MSLLQRTPQPTVRLLWRETRPVVQVIAALRYWAGALTVLARTGSLGPAVVVGALAWLAVMASIYLVNGVSDLPADRANGSARPLARGLVSPQAGARSASALAVLGLVLAALTGDVALVLCAAVMLVLGWAYSVGPRPLKCSVLGTAVACAGGGLLTYLAGAAAAGGSPGGAHLTVFVLLALWMAVGGASKDLGDREGDQAAGRRTLPVLVGSRAAARWIGVACLCLGVGAVCVAWTAPGVWLPALVLAAGAGVVAGRAWRIPGDAARAEQRRPYRAFMVTQYAVNPALLLSVLV